jgi:hypothetical protein
LVGLFYLLKDPNDGTIMPKLVEALGLRANPFEHYVAETEPNIAEYAVKREPRIRPHTFCSAIAGQERAQRG